MQDKGEWQTKESTDKTRRTEAYPNHADYPDPIPKTATKHQIITDNKALPNYAQAMLSAYLRTRMCWEVFWYNLEAYFSLTPYSAGADRCLPSTETYSHNESYTSIQTVGTTSIIHCRHLLSNPARSVYHRDTDGPQGERNDKGDHQPDESINHNIER